MFLAISWAVVRPGDVLFHGDDIGQHDGPPAGQHIELGGVIAKTVLVQLLGRLGQVARRQPVAVFIEADNTERIIVRRGRFVLAEIFVHRFCGQQLLEALVRFCRRKFRADRVASFRRKSTARGWQPGGGARVRPAAAPVEATLAAARLVQRGTRPGIAGLGGAVAASACGGPSSNTYTSVSGLIPAGTVRGQVNGQCAGLRIDLPGGRNVSPDAAAEEARRSARRRCRRSGARRRSA